MSDYVSDDHIESIGEIVSGQARIIQALSLDNSQKDKEIERLNDVVNELIAKNENLMKYKRFIYNIIITPVDCKNPYHYQLHNYTKQNLYEQLYNLRKEIIDELKGDNKNEINRIIRKN